MSKKTMYASRWMNSNERVFAYLPRVIIIEGEHGDLIGLHKKLEEELDVELKLQDASNKSTWSCWEWAVIDLSEVGIDEEYEHLRAEILGLLYVRIIAAAAAMDLEVSVGTGETVLDRAVRIF